MTKINLNASMRSNLLSLQQSQKLQDATQLRLSTGLKVNSASDNPSSYYTAQSLNNRASDLTALLDSMGQGIQTIKTANEALQSATNFLTQASAVAMQALEKAPIELSKDWYIEEAAKQGGVVVSNVAELDKAIDDNKDMIVIYGKIDYTENKGITLKANQKLVGSEYFANINENALYREADNKRISELTFSFSTIDNSGITLNNNSTISDLSIKCLTQMDTIKRSGAIYINKAPIRFVNNVDIDYTATNNTSNFSKSAIMVDNDATLTLSGNVNVKAGGKSRVYGIAGFFNTTINGTANSNINVENNAPSAWAITADGTNAVFNLFSDATLNIKTTQPISRGFYTNSGGNLTTYANSRIFIEDSSANKDPLIANASTFTINEGSYIGIKNNTVTKYSKIETKKIFTSGLSGAVLNNTDGFINSSSWKTANFNEIFNPSPKANVVENESSQYQSILNQYGMLISDSSYKGINLLSGQDLSVIFNENRSSKLDIKGVNASTKNMGLNQTDWKTQEDVTQSIQELTSAINKIQGFMEYFGNNFEIVSNRETFTNNLINTLTEGADKLILADMNKESADMLALQTRQQLATNALSLASKSAQSVLKLF